ncbi:endonuclease/exonuclease/phosphatase family protein, partial [Trifolium pratense]
SGQARARTGKLAQKKGQKEGGVMTAKVVEQQADTVKDSKVLMRSYRSKSDDATCAHNGIVATIINGEAILVAQNRILDAGFNDLVGGQARRGSTSHGFSYRLSVGASRGILTLWDSSEVEVWSTESRAHVYAPCDDVAKQELWDSLSIRIQLVGKRVCLWGFQRCNLKPIQEKLQQTIIVGVHVLATQSAPMASAIFSAALDLSGSFRSFRKEQDRDLFNHGKELFDQNYDWIREDKERLMLDHGKERCAGGALDDGCSKEKVNDGSSKEQVNESVLGTASSDGKQIPARPGVPKGGEECFKPPAQQKHHDGVAMPREENEGSDSTDGVRVGNIYSGQARARTGKLAQKKGQKEGGVMTAKVVEQQADTVKDSKVLMRSYRSKSDDATCAHNGIVATIINGEAILVAQNRILDAGFNDLVGGQARRGSTSHGFSYRLSVGASRGILTLWDSSEVEVWSTESRAHVYAPCDDVAKQELWDSLSIRIQLVGKRVCLWGFQRC